MSSYKRVVISFLFTINLFATDISELEKENKLFYETKYTLFALEYENHGYFNDAYKVYERLYKLTHKSEYLYKYLQMALKIKKYDEVIDKIEMSYTITNIPFKFLEVYAISLYEKKRFYDSLKIYEKIFNKDKNEDILSNIVNIYYSDLNNQKKAKDILSNYVLDNLDSKLALKLLIIYEKDEEYTNVITFLEKLYLNYKDKNEFFFDKTRDLLINYYSRFNQNRALEFFKRNEPNNIDLLVAIYRSLNDTKGAYKYFKEQYLITKELDYLAQIAMYDYEMASEKSDVLIDVINKFDKVLETNKKALYQNYLAYILIDHDIDLNRGISLVKQALKQKPKDISYLDTLAWGKFKLNQCAKAYDIMKDIVEKIGTNNEEIKYHWNKIKECNK